MVVTIAERIHLFPSRTQKLSSLTPKVLSGPPLGRIGSCHLSILRGHHFDDLLFFCLKASNRYEKRRRRNGRFCFCRPSSGGKGDGRKIVCAGSESADQTGETRRTNEGVCREKAAEDGCARGLQAGRRGLRGRETESRRRGRGAKKPRVRRGRKPTRKKYTNNR